MHQLESNPAFLENEQFNYQQKDATTNPDNQEQSFYPSYCLHCDETNKYCPHYN